MDFPRDLALGSVSITAPMTNQVITESADPIGTAIAFVDRLDGATALLVELAFAYGSAGETVTVIVDTRIGTSGTWVDIARFDLATESRHAFVNLSGGAAKGVTGLDPLSSEGVRDGFLGSNARVRVSSTGTYGGNTQLTVRGEVR